MRTRFRSWNALVLLATASAMPGTPARAAAPPSISIGDAAVVEGASGNRAALFNLVLSAPSPGSIQVWFVTASGTAAAGSDYAARSGTVTFPAGSTSAVIAVKVRGDLTPEATETFAVNLAGPVGAVIASGVGAGTIADDDGGGPTRPVATGGWSDLTRVFAAPVKVKVPVTLSAPATAPVSLSLRASCVPATSCTRLPRSGITLRKGQTERTLTFVVDPAGLTQGRLRIALTGGTVTVDRAVRTSVWRTTAATSGLVINEVDYDNVGGDTKEFVEILNGGGAPVSLDGLALVLVNGRDGSEYRRVVLSGTLPAGGYLVVADQAVSVAAGARVLRFPTAHDVIQNGPPDGVVLIDTSGLRLLDALSYEGAITESSLDGFAAPVSLVEGTPATAEDTNTAQGSLARIPNGTDTGNADHDWALVAAPTPGAANHG